MLIHILYRHTDNLNLCGLGKNRPKWFSYDKCLENILSTIDKIDFVKFHMIYDGVYDKKHPRIDYIYNINSKSDYKSWVQACEYAKNLDIDENDLIYYIENDYIHLHGWPYKVKELYETYEEINYVSLYDHVDKYNQEMYPNLQNNLFITPTHHWKITPSTTGTFIHSKKILNQDFDVWINKGLGDHHKFIWLAQNRGRNVLTPIPSLSTHCEVEWLAPTINWNKIN